VRTTLPSLVSGIDIHAQYLSGYRSTCFPFPVPPGTHLRYPQAIRSNGRLAQASKCMIRRRFASILLLLLLPTSAVVAQRVLSVEAISTTPAEFEQKQVTVRGYLFTNKLGHTRLYVSAKEASSEGLSSAIDLLPSNPRSMLGAYTRAECFTVAGTFRQYSDSFYSAEAAGKVGVLYASSIHSCNTLDVAR
jgi:hypothetical protein